MLTQNEDTNEGFQKLLQNGTILINEADRIN